MYRSRIDGILRAFVASVHLKCGSALERDPSLSQPMILNSLKNSALNGGSIRAVRDPRMHLFRHNKQGNSFPESGVPL